jgi:predicted ester cyclase
MADLRRDIEEFYAGITAGDFDRAFRIFAEDVITVEPTLGRSANLAEWRQYDEAFKEACPDASFVLRSAIQEGDRIAAEGSFRGTFAAPLRTPLRELQPTGSSFDVDFAHFFVFRDGKVVEHRVYYDQVDFANQLGIMSPLG